MKTAYYILGFDDVGNSTPVAVLHSANEALMHLKATARCFHRACVTSTDGTEIFPGKLAQEAMDQQA